MAAFSGRFEYLAPGRGAVQEGSCQVSFDEQTFTLVGQGPSIAFDLGDVDVFEPGEYELRLLLYSGQALRLRQFGKAFQDLARQLLDAYRARLVKCLFVGDLDEVARFTGRVHLQAARACDGAAEIRLYESNIAVLPDAAPGFQWRLADIDRVEFDERDYLVVLTRGDERLAIGRLAKRTGELADRLRDRIAVLRERSAKVLHAVFPYLSPDQFRELSTSLREGGCAPIRRLRPLHRLIESSLLEKVVDGALRPYLRALVERAGRDDWHAGFKIVRKDSETAGEDAESSGPEDAGEEPAEPQGAEAAAPAPEVIEVGDGLEVLYWFFFPLGGGGRPARLAWEATSRGGRATYIFDLRAAGGGSATDAAVQAINRGLVALNFRREPVYLKADTLESEARYRHYAIAARKVPELALVRQSFAGRAIHRSLPAWRTQVDKLLG